jgi:hypothetical protein
MRRTSCWGNGKMPFASLLCIMLVICISMLSIGSSGQAASAHTLAPGQNAVAVSRCPAYPLAGPGHDGLLVILLDRSGSLIDQPRATDPNHYSTSVTKVLADLWPGKMTVIPFKGDTTPLQQIGPYAMSDPTQRETLKNQIPEADPHGDTPLGPAMDQALQLMSGAAPGSRVVIITDGEPNTATDPSGLLEEAHIRHDLLKQFCQRQIPVSPFGLEITDPRADTLLSDIATGTGGTYTQVQSPEQLAQNVIHLYRDWQGLALSQPPRDVDGSYSVFINDFASYASIVAFRSDASYHVQLFGSDGKTPVSGVQPLSIDAHYVIYRLDMSSFSTGTYIIKVVNDSGMLDSAAQVYALADYPFLQVKLIVPDGQYVYLMQPLTIKAALFKGQKQYVPMSVAKLTVDITYHISGHPDTTVTSKLDQPGQDVFSHQFPAYTRLGQLRVVIHAMYQGIQKDSQVYTLQLVTPPPLPYMCRKGLVQCFWEEYQLAIWIAIVAVVLLILLLTVWRLWQRQPEPFGYLHSKRNPNADALALRTLRSFPRSLVRKSLISSAEIRNANRSAFPVGPTSFSLVFKPGEKAYIRSEAGDISIELPGQNPPAPADARIGKPRSTTKQGEELQTDTKVPVGTEKELPYKAIIKIKGNPLASFEAVGKVKAKKRLG